ncbi:hypothetical protein VTH8203_01521 [Vibrio thalassae]|uniref:Uncharacterized protein n=1 Tax=Vibrio thalassae TaxID=1243014 RepID=A0A240EH95_9VIBR|nr:hypothetical protein [Vibrio thalassae]SNX47906.1 hypothetical protein VTH8203_01521 [Vibrio thalassae]
MAKNKSTPKPLISGSEYSKRGVTRKKTKPLGGWGSSKAANQDRKNGAKMAEIEAYAKKHKITITQAMVELME